MPLYSSSYLAELGERYENEIRLFSLDESKATHTFFDIFLCHSFLDRKVIFGLFYELKRIGYKVYVDWIIDPQLDRNNVTKESATIVRNRLKSSKSLLYAISTNSQMSKWMPWELGYVDGHTSRCAIVPISNQSNETSFKGKEYLSLYPIVKKYPDRNNIQKLWTAEETNKYVLFEKWFAEKADPTYQTTQIF